MGLAGAERDAVGRARLRARRRVVVLGALPGGDQRGHDVRALGRRDRRVLRRLGGTSRAWRTDRMATVVYPGSDRITAQFAQVAKHYGVEVWVCPPRRPQRKGVVEKAI
jgi:hypothetical protein